MKKICKSIILAVLLWIFVNPVLSADFSFENSFVSDNTNFLTDRYENPLAEVLKNLSDETGCDLVVLTLDSLSENETFEDIEKQIHSKYLFGGKNKDKWVIITVTRNPYRINIRVGEGLRKIIPPKTIRAMGIEFLLNRGTLNNANANILQRRAQDNLYSTALFLAELIADSKNKRLHTTRRTVTHNYSYRAGDRVIVEPLYTETIPETYIPQTRPMNKFIRRNNLYPALIILGIGLFPLRFLYRYRRGYRRLR